MLILFILAGCAMKIDATKAQAMVENLLEDLKHEKYDDIEKYYSSASNDTEPLDKKIAKYNKLKDVTGSIQSYSLISSILKYDDDKNLNELELKYKVNCEKLTLTETFLIINDEGDYKIIFQNMENEE